MSDQELQDSCYIPSGVPITPQARRFGYEFPVWVSKTVWAEQCVAVGIKSRHGTNLDRRIIELLQYCYEGMTKRLTQSDDFVYYHFKIWYWSRAKPNAKKKKRARLGARLLIDPSTGGPWLYIFNERVDTIDALEVGELPPQEAPETIHPHPSVSDPLQ